MSKFSCLFGESYPIDRLEKYDDPPYPNTPSGFLFIGKITNLYPAIKKKYHNFSGRDLSINSCYVVFRFNIPLEMYRVVENHPIEK